MTFVGNHDKNAWEGTEFEAFGPGLGPAMVLSVVGEGMPPVYNGQEAGAATRPGLALRAYKVFVK